jgi:hypothetical protein
MKVPIEAVPPGWTTFRYDETDVCTYDISITPDFTNIGNVPFAQFAILNKYSIVKLPE